MLIEIFVTQWLFANENNAHESEFVYYAVPYDSRILEYCMTIGKENFFFLGKWYMQIKTYLCSLKCVMLIVTIIMLIFANENGAHGSEKEIFFAKIQIRIYLC